MFKEKGDHEPLELKEIARETWSFIFYSHGDRYFLSVACGTVGVYCLDIELTQKERKAYLEEGIEYVAQLAKTFYFDPDEFKFRHIKSFSKWPRKALN